MADHPENRHSRRWASRMWFAVRKSASRFQDWFAIQPVAIRCAVVALVALIPVTALYSITLIEKHAALTAEVERMAKVNAGKEELWSLNEALPVVFGSGSVLSFLESHPADRVTVIYKPLT
jgi:cell division protease FtsH